MAKALRSLALDPERLRVNIAFTMTSSQSCNRSLNHLGSQFHWLQNGDNTLCAFGNLKQ